MKKYNEKMIVRNGKMVYAISLEDKNNKSSDRTHIIIENGKVFLLILGFQIVQNIILMMKHIKLQKKYLYHNYKLILKEGY